MARTLRIPTHKAPPTPGAVIAEEYRKPMGLTQQQFADALGIDRTGFVALERGRRAITPEMALRLARVLGPSEQFWLNLQQITDIYKARHSAQAAKIAKLKPLRAKIVA